MAEPGISKCSFCSEGRDRAPPPDLSRHLSGNLTPREDGLWRDPSPEAEWRTGVRFAGDNGKRGTPKSLLSTSRRPMYRGEFGQAYPHLLSFNQEIKLLGSLKFSIHGRGPLIQL